MAKAMRALRCKCCEEVLEELLHLRQNWEKNVLNLTKEILELRREMRDLLLEKGEMVKHEPPRSEDESLPNANFQYVKIDSGTPIQFSPPTVQYEERFDEIEPPPPDYLLCPAKGIRAGIGTCIDPVENELSEYIKIPKIMQTTADDTKSTNDTLKLEFPAWEFAEKVRAMPIRPFATAEDYEKWDGNLGKDEYLRVQLRAELLKNAFEEPHQYIKHVWTSVLSDKAAASYSYRGYNKTNKKGIKGHTFTAIFRECFLYRYQQFNGSFFSARTMRFFHYTHDRLRRARICKLTGPSENVELEIPPYDGDVVEASSVDQNKVKHSMDEVVGENSTDEVVGENSTDEVVGENSTEEVVGENSTDEVVGENSTEEVVGENSMDVVVGENSMDVVVGENSMDVVVGENSMDDEVGEISIDEYELPVDKRHHTMKRVVNIDKMVLLNTKFNKKK